MWMMGYNDGGDLYMADSFGGRKLRPLIPRPIPAAATTGGSGGCPGIATPPCLGRLHNSTADVFSLSSNHMGMMSEQSKREFNSPQHQVLVSSRWNPTPEQLRTLEELYRRGTRTPSADQIQHITAQLRRYGKIEGKNVFYWFQNHKARERQKRRRQMESDDGHQSLDAGVGGREADTHGRKETAPPEGPGSNKPAFGVVDHQQQQQQHNSKNINNNWAPPMNCSSTVAEVSATPAALKMLKAGGGQGQERTLSLLEHQQEWMKIDESGEPLCRRSVNGAWQMMQHQHQLSRPPPTHLINSSPAMDPKLINTNNNTKPLSNRPLTGFLIAPPHPPYGIRQHDDIFVSSHLLNISDEDDDDVEVEEGEYETAQTLQLFPLRSGDGYTGEKETEMSVSAINSFVAHPQQFFEFLPLKN